MSDLFKAPEPIGRFCTKCKTFKTFDHFYKRVGRKFGVFEVCKICYNVRARERFANDPRRYATQRETYWGTYRERANKRSEEFYYSEDGRARSLMNQTVRRSKQKGWDNDIDKQWFIDRLRIGKCSVTGIAFDFSKPNGVRANPYAPSIDRIDSKIGYLKSNCRLVIWQFNLMKGEISDAELVKICKKVVENVR